MKYLPLIFSCLCLSLLSGTAMAEGDTQKVKQSEVLELEWIDLIPESERNQFDKKGMPIQIDHNGQAGANLQSKVGGVRPELNGSIVKIPGFVIPLEGDNEKVTEFLLVPFMGACIHVPPPPPNQLIYVRFKGGAPIQELWDITYLTGRLNTETVNHELAEVAYTIDGMMVEAYEY